MRPVMMHKATIALCLYAWIAAEPIYGEVRVGKAAEYQARNGFPGPGDSRPARLSGWAKVRYTIDASGAVSAAQAIDASVPFLARTLSRMAGDWRFDPAIRDGTAARQCGNESFMLWIYPVPEQLSVLQPGDSRAPVRFNKYYRKIREALDSNDIDRANRDIEFLEKHWLDAKQVAYLDMAKADIAGYERRPAEQLHFLRRAAEFGNQFLDQEMYELARYSILLLELQLLEVLAAKHTWAEVQTFELEPADRQSLKAAIDRIDAGLAGPAVHVVHARLDAETQVGDCASYWEYRPVRQRFAIELIDGSLDSLEIRCANTAYSDTVAIDRVWQIPGGDDECAVLVFGDADTRFNFLALSGSASAPEPIRQAE